MERAFNSGSLGRRGELAVIVFLEKERKKEICIKVCTYVFCLGGETLGPVYQMV